MPETRITIQADDGEGEESGYATITARVNIADGGEGKPAITGVHLNADDLSDDEAMRVRVKWALRVVDGTV